MVPRRAVHLVLMRARPTARYLVQTMVELTVRHLAETMVLQMVESKVEHWAVTMALSMAVPKVELTGQRRVVNSVCSRAERKVLLMVSCLAAWTAP